MYVHFAFKIFSIPVPLPEFFWQVPDPSRPEVKNPYPSDPDDKVSDAAEILVN